MNSIEAATILTKAAIEKNMIDFDTTYCNTRYEDAESKNKHNAEQIAAFYTIICNAINQAEK